MSTPLQVQLAGYAPRESSHGRALDLIATRLRGTLGDRVEVEITYNILDAGRPVQGLLDDVEQGALTLCYFSTSYLADRVPELGIVDLPYVFASLEQAHAALDGQLGTTLSERTRTATALVPLGYWDNGFRHLSNRHRDVRRPQDVAGLRVRLQPNWAHEALFRELGAEPVCNDLREGIAMLRSGELDAQENPLANMVAYGVDEVHPHLSLTGHVYGARGVYASAQQLDGWSLEARDALADAVAAAIVEQRADAARTEARLREQLLERGTRVLDLTHDEHAAFEAVAEPVLDTARERFDDAVWRLLPS